MIVGQELGQSRREVVVVMVENPLSSFVYQVPYRCF